MADGFVHTVFRDGTWINEIEGSHARSGAFDTKALAVEAGREEARRGLTEHVIHNRDGTIGARNSYGSDPASRLR
jgi:hypothetical protein